MTDLVAPPVRSPTPGQRWAMLDGPGPMQIGTSATTLYTAPNVADISGRVSSTCTLIDLWVANVDLASARLFTLYVVPSGGSATDATTVIPTCSLKATESVHYGVMKTLIPPGGTLQAKTDSANKLTITPTFEVVR